LKNGAETRSGIARIVPLAIVAVVAVAGAIWFRDDLSFEMLRQNHAALADFRDAHYLKTVLAFIATYVGIVAFSLPGATVMTLTGGFLFSTFPGTLFNVVSATIGATLIFLAARWGLGTRLAARMDASSGRVRQLKQGIDRNQVPALFLMRLVPAVPFFVANLVPAFVGVPTHRFVLTTFFGIIPGAVVYTSVGSGLGEVFARGGNPDLEIAFEPRFLLPLLGLAALAALPIAINVARRRT
jgi:uncharacterized membrane protein YdjX (TVP38/TMEM64 family)